MVASKFSLAISEIFCPYIHGINSNSDPLIVDTFLVFATISLEEFYDEEHEEIIELMTTHYNTILNNTSIELHHPFIRNYRNIARNFIRLEIVKLNFLYTGELVCTMHTFWIKIIQRKWKKIYMERKNILYYRKKLCNMMNRELIGKYKINNYYPHFKLGIKI